MKADFPTMFILHGAVNQPDLLTGKPKVLYRNIDMIKKRSDSFLLSMNHNSDFVEPAWTAQKSFQWLTIRLSQNESV